MSEISSPSAFDVKYCSLCDEYFYSQDMLKDHLQRSSKHPKCTTCKKSFLNNNSLRNHYVLSSRHHFCRVCEKSFKTSSGLRIHLEYAHMDSDAEDEIVGPDGWEDEMARRQDALITGGEIPLPAEDLNDAPLSTLEVGVAVTNLQKSAKPRGVLALSCPICLSTPKKMCATRCGHVFCSSCITYVLETAEACPTCRQPALATQLRSLDMHIYGCAD
ncbi:hypothetical protein C8J57DRAFT_266573 [Mycena rebaudengoi]|nr:hypothetical protein C8J57DRAFT_266573 [Mycena rebaudengoi]